MKDISIIQNNDEIECKTQEEYDKIIDLLKQKNFKLGKCMSFEFRFIFIHNIFKIGGNSTSSNLANNKYQASEFLEEEFPEKWCIKTNRQDFFDWLNKNSQTQSRSYGSAVDRRESYYRYPKCTESNSHIDCKIPNDCKQITFEQFEKKYLKEEIKETNKMKTTRKKLLSIRGKDTCNEFNSLIDDELKANFQRTDDEEFTIHKDIINNNLYRTNNNQKELLKSIGLIKELDLFSITTYEEVCEALKEKTLNNIYLGSDNQINCKKLLTLARLDQIQRLYNGDWKKDWSDNTTQIYYPFFMLINGKWEYKNYSSNDSYSHGLIAFKDSETAKYVGKTFINIYQDILE